MLGNVEIRVGRDIAEMRQYLADLGGKGLILIISQPEVANSGYSVVHLKIRYLVARF
jgi:hypothetical protein